MPLMIENGVVTRITFDHPVAEQPIKESWLREFIHKLLVLVSGG